MKKALVISGTSTIGMELIKQMQQDYEDIIVTGRNQKKLEALQQQFPQIQTIPLDVTQNPRLVLEENENLWKDLDFVLLCAGAGEINPSLEPEIEEHVIQVNVNGCGAILRYFVRLFWKKDKGHIAVITSLAGMMPNGDAAGYGASKAFLSHYIAAIRMQLKKEKSHVTLTDIRPGLVDTPMAKGEKLFWVAPVEKAAKQIYAQLRRKKERIIVTKRWKVLYIICRILPLDH
ncbi:SDR family NAD(P)-dependent oxidoreductase [Anaerotignum sp.]|uniref:SDR family NAD(P)-dependent oxidoreductase n=1 Tax=Anaerotignum sp. TaxID=2039241 RepID=UPI0037364A3A